MNDYNNITAPIEGSRTPPRSDGEEITIKLSVYHALHEEIANLQAENAQIIAMSELMKEKADGYKSENARLRAEWQFDKETADRLIEHSTKRADKLALENLRLRAALEAVEWVTINVSEAYFVFCPSCRRSKQDDHASDCQRQVALGIAEEK